MDDDGKGHQVEPAVYEPDCYPHAPALRKSLHAGNDSKRDQVAGDEKKATHNPEQIFQDWFQ